MYRRLCISVLILSLVLLSIGVITLPQAEAQLGCPPEVERLIEIRSQKLTNSVLGFYDSWSAKELKAGKKPGKGFTVAVGVGGQTRDASVFGFWGQIRRLEEMGCKVIPMVGQSGGAGTDITAILENFVARKPDAISMCFSNSQILGPGLEKAGKRQIPVFGLDNWLSGPSVYGEVTSDNFYIGLLTARYVITRLGGEGNVVELFSPGHRGLECRNKMWELVTKEYPGIKEISRQPWTNPNVIDSVRDRMEAVLLANPKKGDIRAVHANFDLAGMGAADAIEAAGRADEIFVIGTDGDREAFKRIAKGGAFQATVSQDHMLMSTALAHMIVDCLNGKDIPRFLFCPVTLVTKENVYEAYEEKWGEELKI